MKWVNKIYFYLSWLKSTSDYAIHGEDHLYLFGLFEIRELILKMNVVSQAQIAVPASSSLPNSLTRWQ